ncbi:MAG TPA: glucose-6-phosphate dehydrogenase, partial [Acidimicrobiia bacterium]|nr:glucose-6-phosphate dehydrogenase [Acidimicrobiia bacterium]
RLGAAGLATSPGWTRIVVEKPFGSDLTSARGINAALHTHFAEQQIYRIDHYLGKETVQNLLVFRFTNPIFEASWNRDRVERVEITVAETLDLTGRGPYYDRTGVVADMVQSHLTQVLSLVAMEAPSTFAADAVRDEKVKVLRSIREIPPAALRLGQFGPGEVAGRHLGGYRETTGVAPDSSTPTFAAVRVWIDNWRWQGVPFLLRTGRALPRRTTEVAVLFRQPPVCLFHGVVDDCIAGNDILRLVLQPDEGFSLEVDVKEPGTSTRLHPVSLHFSYQEEFGRIPEAYETLLADVIEGDQTLFVRSDEVEESWRLYTPLLGTPVAVDPYPAGTWGPSSADDLLPQGAVRWATAD